MMPNIKGGLKYVNKMLAPDQAYEALAKFDAGSKMSKAENIAAGLYHPIGEGKKLNIPFSRMTSTVVDNPNVTMHQGRTITPEQAVKDKMGFFPLIGDRADTGKILTHVNNRKAKYETPLTGGGKYGQANYDPMMEKSSAWESGANKVGALRNRITDIAESGYKPVGVFSPGSHVQVDFNTMMPHALLGQFDQTDTTKKLVKQFDKEVKSIYPDWVGITSPEAEAQLMQKNNGGLRTVFTKTMGKDDYQSGGFPDVPSVRKAISDPDLFDTELGTLGQNIALFEPTGALVATPKHPSSYPLSMSGQNIGKMDETEKFSDFFTTANNRRRLLSSDPAGDYRSFELSQPIQYADEEWLNKLMETRRLRDEAIKKGGYAEGGAIDIEAADARLEAAMGQRMATGGIVDIHPRVHEILSAPPISMKAGGTVKHFDGGGMAMGEDPYVAKPERMSDIKKNAVELYEDATREVSRLKNPEAAKQYAKILAAQALGTVPDYAPLAVKYLNPLEMLPGAKLLKTGLTGTGVLDKPGYRSVLESTDNQTSPRVKYQAPREPLGFAKALENEDGNALFGIEDLIKRQQESGKMYGKTVYARNDDGSFARDEDGDKIQLYQTGRFGPLMEFAGSVAAGAGLSKLAKGATKAAEGFGRGFDKGHARAMSKQPPFLQELEYAPTPVQPRARGGLTQLRVR